MYTFTKFNNQLERWNANPSSNGKGNINSKLKATGPAKTPTTTITKKSPLHIPNESVLLDLDHESCTFDVLNVEDWMNYWRQNLTRVFRSTILNPKPCSTLIKNVKTELKQQAENQKVIFQKLDLYDPHTLNSIGIEDASSADNNNSNSGFSISHNSQNFQRIQNPEPDDDTGDVFTIRSQHNRDRQNNQSQQISQNQKQPYLNNLSLIQLKSFSISETSSDADADAETESDETDVEDGGSQFSHRDRHRHKNRRRNQKPKNISEDIQQLYSHVAAISASCAQAYGKCKDLNEAAFAPFSTNIQGQGQEYQGHLDSNNSDPHPIALLINVLAHQIGGLDVSVRTSLPQVCKLFLEGISEIVDTIQFLCDIRSGNGPHPFESFTELKLNQVLQFTKPIASFLNHVNSCFPHSSKSSPRTRSETEDGDDADAKYYFIKIQMEALLVTIWPPGSVNFQTGIQNLQSTINETLHILKDRPNFFVNLDWENNYKKHYGEAYETSAGFECRGGHYLRDQYFLIMEKFYFENARFSNHYNSADVLQKLNRHAQWLKHFHQNTNNNCKNNSNSRPATSTGTGTGVNTETGNGPNNFEKDSENKGNNNNFSFNFQNNNKNYDRFKSKSKYKHKFNFKYRRYRSSKDLIIDLANNLLHINNSRTKFMRLTMMADLQKQQKIGVKTENNYDTETESNLESQSCDILVDILQHQILGLDIALSSQIFNSIKCFVHGMYDTSCSIMNIMSAKYYDQATHTYRPLTAESKSEGDFTGTGAGTGNGDGDTFDNRSAGNPFSSLGYQPPSSSKPKQNKNRLKLILETIEISNGIINNTTKAKPKSKANAKLKHALLKLQLEALVLTETKPDTEIFRQYLEVMAGTAENAYHILNQQWFIPYLSICWDDASAEDQLLYYNYWQLIEFLSTKSHCKSM